MNLKRMKAKDIIQQMRRKVTDDIWKFSSIGPSNNWGAVS